MMEDEIAELLEHLIKGDENLAERSSVKLAAYGEMVVPLLEERLESSEVDQRWWAIRTIAQMTSPPMDLLLRSLDDKSSEVQQCAALSIYHHPDLRAVPLLIKLIEDTDNLTVNLAASALIAIGKGSTDSLLEKYPDFKGVSKIEAIRALACIQDEKAIPVLLSALDEDSLSVNYWAEEGLNRLGLGMEHFIPD